MTSYSPMSIIFGADQYNLVDYTFNPDDPKEYIDYMVNRQTIIRNNANERQRIYDQLRKKNWDKNKHDERLEIGSLVLWNINSQFTGNAQKLGPKWVGPYEVIACFNNQQNFKIRVIPMMDNNNNNPMNKQKVPMKKTTGINGSTVAIPIEFNVPRSQIKPYKKSFEEQFDGTQSPAQIAILALNDHIQTVSGSSSLYQDKSHSTHLAIFYKQMLSIFTSAVTINKFDVTTGHIYVA